LRRVKKLEADEQEQKTRTKSKTGKKKQKKKKPILIQTLIQFSSPLILLALSFGIFAHSRSSYIPLENEKVGIRLLCTVTNAQVNRFEIPYKLRYQFCAIAHT
jgi:hypothetical protein